MAMKAPVPLPPDPEPDLARSLAEVKRLTDASRIPDARRMLVELSQKAPDHPDVIRWNKILGRPEIRVVSPKSPRESIADYDEWFRTEAAQYNGQWVALRGGKAIGSDADYAKLYRDLKARSDVEGALFVPVGLPY